MSDTTERAATGTEVLRADHLSKHYRLRGRGQRRTVRAADDVDLALHSGRVTAVVGESGSGKSTVARMLARLTTQSSGSILLDGADARRRPVHDYRRAVQLVFQDPFASFNPAHTVRHHIERPLRNYLKLRGAALDEAVDQVLERVRLDPSYADKYPYELSGGQLQRAAIARALAPKPKVLLADEPVSMLDVSIRLGILNLLEELREDGIAVLYVTHDIASARYFADEIVVMYSGQIVERGSSLEVTDDSSHPYTQLLLSAAPDPERAEAPAVMAAASGAATGGAASGCRFSNRCPFAMERCATQPPHFSLGDGHSAACWLLDTSEAATPGRNATGAAAE